MNTHIHSIYRSLCSGTVLGLLAFSVPAAAHHVSIGGPAGTSGPILTMSTETIGKGKFSIGLTSQFIKYDEFSNEQLEGFAAAGFEEVHSTDDALVWSIGLEYGITDKLSVGLVAPYIRRTGIREGELEDDGTPEVDVLGNVDGFGDITVLGKYRLVEPTIDRGLSFAIIGGLQLPTGSTDETQINSARFEQEFQPGSGATRPILGLALAQQYERFGIYSSLLYSFSDRGSQDTELGDVFAYNVGVAYRYGRGPHVHDDGTFERHTALDYVLELNGEWQDSEAIGADIDPHSGGNQLFLSPGIRYLSKNRWSAALSIGIPIVDNLKGIQNDPEPRAVASIGFDF